jgi:hypothetical protein
MANQQSDYDIVTPAPQTSPERGALVSLRSFQARGVIFADGVMIIPPTGVKDEAGNATTAKSE